jgi:FkbM family methyltransferase
MARTSSSFASHGACRALARRLALRLRPLARRLSRIRGLRRITRGLERAFVGVSSVVIDDFDGRWRFDCDLSEHMSAHIFWQGAYSGDQLRELRQRLPSDGVFIDAGANHGEFTVAGAGLAPTGRVYAFEPAPWLQRRLLRNVQLNDFTNVTLVPLGLADRHAVLPFYDAPRSGRVTARNGGLISLYPDAQRTEPAGTFAVTPLDDWARTIQLDRLDVLKADVEGAELSLLRGATATIERFRPVMLLECNDNSARAAGHSAAALVAYLRNDLRYDLYVVTAQGAQRLRETETAPTFCNLLCLPR